MFLYLYQNIQNINDLSERLYIWVILFPANLTEGRVGKEGNAEQVIQKRVVFDPFREEKKPNPGGGGTGGRA